MYINVPHLDVNGQFQNVNVFQQNSQSNQTNSQGNGNTGTQVHSVGHGRGGEYTYTHCNGVGNINSPCQGKPTYSVPEPSTAIMLATVIGAVALMRKFKTSHA